MLFSYEPPAELEQTLYTFAPPYVESKEAVELAYSRRSKPFNRKAVERKFEQLDINDQDEALKNLIQNVVEYAIYDLNRINEIRELAISEIIHYKVYTVWSFLKKRYVEKYGYEMAYFNKDVEEEIDVDTQIKAVTQSMDIVFKVFKREYLQETIQHLNNRLAFLRNLADHPYYPLIFEVKDTFNKNSVHRFLGPYSLREFLNFEPKIREVVESVFPVPSYKLIFTGRHFVLPVNRTPQQFKEDREIFAYARDMEPAILQYLIHPQTAEDIQWQENRKNQWNEQINIIRDIEREISMMHEKDFFEAEDSFYKQDYLEAERSYYDHARSYYDYADYQAARQSFYDTANRMSSQPGQPRQSIQPRQRRYSDYSADPNYQGL